MEKLVRNALEAMRKPLLLAHLQGGHNMHYITIISGQIILYSINMMVLTLESLFIVFILVRIL